MSKVQKVSITLRMGFALSKRPYFNSIHLARVPFLNGIAVYMKCLSVIDHSGWLQTDRSLKQGLRCNNQCFEGVENHPHTL